MTITKQKLDSRLRGNDIVTKLNHSKSATIHKVCRNAKLDSKKTLYTTFDGNVDNEHCETFEILLYWYATRRGDSEEELVLGSAGILMVC